ncbi:MAG: PLDc N-terminal domain-containing protein [Candidatus Dormibacteria bacterium]
MPHPFSLALAAIASPRLNPAVLAPVVLIELALLGYCLVDLARRQVVVGGRKWPWALLILLVGGLGPITYLLFGRRDA